MADSLSQEAIDSKQNLSLKREQLVPWLLEPLALHVESIARVDQLHGHFQLAAVDPNGSVHKGPHAERPRDTVRGDGTVAKRLHARRRDDVQCIKRREIVNQIAREPTRQPAETLVSAQIVEE